jgi:acylphosphatase
MKTSHIIVNGRVQGVFFRATARRIAIELGIKGTVENKDDGSVEIYAQGQRMQEFVSRLKQAHGLARVDEIKTSSIEHVGFDDFSIL